MWNKVVLFTKLKRKLHWIRILKFLEKIQNLQIIEKFFFKRYKIDDINKIKIMYLYNVLPAEEVT